MKYSTFGKQPKYEADDTLTFGELARISLTKLTSTEASPFLYKGHIRFGLLQTEPKRFIHEKARNGLRFTDGNNGDYWRVITAMPEYNRMIVQNLSQDYVTIMWWER